MHEEQIDYWNSCRIKTFYLQGQSSLERQSRDKPNYAIRRYTMIYTHDIQYITSYAHIFCKSIYVYIVSLVHYFWTLFLNKSEMVAVCCISLAHLRKMSLVAPDLCSQNTMITGLEKHQLWRAALNHFQLVQDFSTPDVQTYSAAIMSCSSGELWQAALVFLEKLLKCFVWSL